MAENIIKFPTPEGREIGKAIEEAIEEAEKKEKIEEREESEKAMVPKLREAIQAEHPEWSNLQVEEEIVRRTGIEKEAGQSKEST